MTTVPPRMIVAMLVAFLILAPACTQDLREAAEDGQVERVKELLAEGAEVDGRDDRGETALMRAAQSDNTDIVQVLLAAGAYVNAKTPFGGTALMYAVWLGPARTVRALLDGGMTFYDVKDPGGTIPMNATGSTETVRVLLNAGADVDAKSEIGYTALMLASRAPTETVRVLLDASADVNARTETGSTALMSAALNGHIEAVQAFLHAGADVNAETIFVGMTALMNALVVSCDAGLVKLLLDAGADVNAEAKAGLTPLWFAEISCTPEIVELLKKAGAKE